MKEIRSRIALRNLQRQMASLIMNPLTKEWNMRRRIPNGRDVGALAEDLIKPNDRLDSFERLEIYNRCYWYRLLDSLYDDFPGLLAILGNSRFLSLATAYLTRFPSESFTLRDLGGCLEEFLTDEPQWIAPYEAMALDMVRFEWAQIMAFDGPSREPIGASEIGESFSQGLRLGLQPYISLLRLEYGVDDYLVTLKKFDEARLRGGASNTATRLATPDSIGDMESASKDDQSALPRKEQVHLVVHRHNNTLYSKRIEPGAFALLTALRHGAYLDVACGLAMRNQRADPSTFASCLTEWFRDWASLGWLTNFQPHSNLTHQPSNL